MTHGVRFFGLRRTQPCRMPRGIPIDRRRVLICGGEQIGEGSAA
jgi:hypothetical protein